MTTMLTESQLYKLSQDLMDLSVYYYFMMEKASNEDRKIIQENFQQELKKYRSTSVSSTNIIIDATNSTHYSWSRNHPTIFTYFDSTQLEFISVAHLFKQFNEHEVYDLVREIQSVSNNIEDKISLLPFDPIIYKQFFHEFGCRVRELEVFLSSYQDFEFMLTGGIHICWNSANPNLLHITQDLDQKLVPLYEYKEKRDLYHLSSERSQC